MKKKKRRPSFEDLIPDPVYRKEIEEGLLSGKPWIGKHLIAERG